MNASTSDLDFSVVLTLMDDRGQTEECLSSWTRGQSFARDRYEVIVVGSGRELAVETIVRPLLTSGDRLLRHAAPNELALHDFGARQARGKWLLFTEAHCVAAPECLQALHSYLQAYDDRYAGACIRTVTDGRTQILPRLEERWYTDGFSDWSREDDWRKVTIRGTAVRRDAYESVGGFKVQFGCFAECLLGAELDARGYRLGYVPEARVKHYNSTDLREILDYVREYREGEVAFQAHSRAAAFAQYFEWSGSWQMAGRAGRQLARVCAARSLARAITHPLRAGALSMARTMLGVLLGSVLDGATGGRKGVIKAAAVYAHARAMFAWPVADFEARYRRYCQLWNAAGEFARERALARRRSLPPERSLDSPSQSLTLRLGDMRGGALVGFHERESFDDEAFRWSSPLALVPLSIPARDYEVFLETKGLAGKVPPEYIDVYLDGHRLSHAFGMESGKITFHADRSMFRDAARQSLVLTSGRLRTEGSAERRSLGVPLFAIRFVERGGATHRVDAPSKATVEAI